MQTISSLTHQDLPAFSFEKLTNPKFVLWFFMFFSLIIVLWNYEFDNDPENIQLTSMLEKGNSSYQIFTSPKKGLYNTIGNFLAQHKADPNEEFNIEIVNKETNGGFDNVVKVLGFPNSFGLIQEATLDKDDDLRQQIQYIAPLYMEKMHILYNYKEFKRKSKDADVPMLSSDLDPDTKAFFEESQINVGPIGSGTQVVSNLILNGLNLKCKKEMTETHDYASKMIREKKISIMFLMAGAPTYLVSNLLNTKDTSVDMRLMSINPEAIEKINLKYNKHLHPTDFKDKYINTTLQKGMELDGISTLGSLSYLIASKNTSSKAVLTLLRELNNSKKKFKEQLRDSLNYSPKASFTSPLQEMDFLTSYELFFFKMSNELKSKKLWLWIYCIASGFILFIGCSWIQSFWNRYEYLKKLSAIYNEKFARGEELNEENRPFFTPSGYKGSISPILRNAITATQEIAGLLKQARIEYGDGGINDQHYKFLNDKLKESSGDFKNLLARCLYRSICNEEERRLLDNILGKNYIDGILEREDFDKLSDDLHMLNWQEQMIINKIEE